MWPQLQRHYLPLHRYTAREVINGRQYAAFVQECMAADSKLFAEIIIFDLRSCGVRFKRSRFQTNNECEFVCNWQAK